MKTGTMSRQEPIVVLGAGPAGIGAGIGLGSRGVVLDGCRDPGGLCRTIELDGAVFDLGGHSFHTPHPQVRELVFSELEMVEQRRDARCYCSGTMIPYPFQAHFRQLGDERVVRECLEGLSSVDQDSRPGNFEEHLTGRFGAGIARHFLLPYNRKLWGTDLKRLAADWVGERVAAPEGAQERFAERGGKRSPLQADTSVAYPARGGFGEIMKALAKRLPDLRLGKTVERLFPGRREAVLADGEILRWDRFVSTMPIDRLLSMLPDVPAGLRADVSRLRVLSLALVLVVVGHPVDTPIQRVYCADERMPGHKVVVNHNSSDFLRALPHHGILVEVSQSAEKSLPDDAHLEQQVVRGLLEMGLLASAAEVLRTKTVHVPNGYPIPTHDRNAIVSRVKCWLEERRICTVGRFGEWAYINSDEALHRGLSLGAALVQV